MGFLESLWDLHQQVFGNSFTKRVSNEIFKKIGPHILLALQDSKVVGFKIGYESKPRVFYSWSGAVSEDFQGRGIGKHLMKLQHEWCRAQGYEKIQTKTKNKWKSMLILNLKNGFKVEGTYLDEWNETKIVLEKLLK